MGSQESQNLRGISPVYGGLGTAQLAPPWSRQQVRWVGRGYFVLRLATEDVSRWLVGAAYAWNEVLAHERTFRRAAVDKAEIMTAIKMNPWPAHLACGADPVRWRESLAAAVKGLASEIDTGHLTLWRLTHLPRGLEFGKPLVVLDGHHSRKAQQSLCLPSVFGWLEPLGSPQLQVGAIHRAGLLAQWLDQGVQEGELRECKAPDGLWSAESSLAFEVVRADRRYWLEVARPEAGEAVVDALVRLSKKRRVTLKSSASFDEILGWLKHMEVDAALRLPAPTKDYVRARAEGHRLFPQKATYFHPKVPFGTLVADFRGR